MSSLFAIIIFVLFGALAGWLTAQIMHLKTGFWGNALLGVIGSALGSIVLRVLGGPGFTGITIYSLFVSVGGACLFTWIVRQIDGKGMKKR
jgi:uncharacterized membrane protein YeaQ/YmgE (transglycosylase-associated protein family)